MLLPKLVAKLHALYSQPYFFCRHASEPHINGSEAARNVEAYGSLQPQIHGHRVRSTIESRTLMVSNLSHPTL